MDSAEGFDGVMSRGELTPRSFSIPRHVRVCVTRDGAVFLDLKKDRYCGLGRDETALLAGSVEGWRESTGERGASPNWEEAIPLCRSLVEDGLLVAGQSQEESRGEGHRASVDMNVDWVSVGDELEVEGRIGFADVARFFTAFAWARFSLRFRSLENVVASVARAKARVRVEAAARGPIESPVSGWVDANAMRREAALIDKFRRLRTLVFAAEGRCLLHAVTLIKFLAAYGVRATWVIGVTTQPWGAHSWVQEGCYLFDSNPEKVCKYSPILVV
jgi:hypothetical protein